MTKTNFLHGNREIEINEEKNAGQLLQNSLKLD